MRSAYRRVAGVALGRALKPTEHVHHHSATQLVICDKDYHVWLHRVMRARQMRGPVHAWRSSVVMRVSEAAYRELKRRSAEERRTVRAMIDRLVEDVRGE